MHGSHQVSLRVFDNNERSHVENRVGVHDDPASGHLDGFSARYKVGRGDGAPKPVDGPTFDDYPSALGRSAGMAGPFGTGVDVEELRSPSGGEFPPEDLRVNGLG